MRRAHSAESRRESENRKSRNLATWKLGHKEEVYVNVEIRLASGKVLKKLRFKEDSREATYSLRAETSKTLCMGRDRLRLGYQGHELNYKRTMFQLLKGSRFAQITCVILPPVNCTECGAAAVLSGWKNLLTGLPEYHKKCDCWDLKFEEYGYRPLRLWTQMVVAWHRSLAAPRIKHRLF